MSKKSVYIIGEIGQNHNGSVEIAKRIIDKVAEPVKDPLFNTNLRMMDAIKLTKRDLNEELSSSAMLKPYTGTHSFGKTYGEHRAYLELSDDDHFEIYKYTKSKNLDFVETLCATGCLSLIKLFTPDKLKVASRDLTNLPLLSAMAETKIPIILSTGMGGKKELDKALETISKYHDNISILHCLSQYPAEYQNINLNTILFLKENYQDFKIGYSDHSIGIMVPVAAVSMGAEIIEKHITLDREMKGTDHQGSLGVDGISRMVRDIRNLEMALGNKDIFVDDCVIDSRIKLERSIATKHQIKRGAVLTENDFHLLSPGDGYKWNDRENLIGKIAITDIDKNEIIYKKLVK